MQENKIIAITGPSGSGKTTVARALCKEFKKCVHLDIDVIKHLIENGFVYDDSPEGKRQWLLLTKNIINLCRNFCKDGYNIIIEGYINLESPGWPEIFSDLKVDYKFVLLPNLDVLKARDKARVLDFQMGDEDVTEHYHYFLKNINVQALDFVVLDTSEQSVNEVVRIMCESFQPSLRDCAK